MWCQPGCTSDEGIEPASASQAPQAAWRQRSKARKPHRPEPSAARVRSSGAKPEVGGRLHVHLDCRRLAVCSCRDGPVLASHRRLSDTMRARMVSDALLMALWRRGKPTALMHHSDQGSQYTSDDFQQLLKSQSIKCSMRRRGECWDNAATESFFSTLKTERCGSALAAVRPSTRETTARPSCRRELLLTKPAQDQQPGGLTMRWSESASTMRRLRFSTSTIPSPMNFESVRLTVSSVRPR